MDEEAVHSGFEDLRRRAEELLKGQGSEKSRFSGMDILTLIHQLEVHQVELQIQNEELQWVRGELEKSRKEYADLYEFAPVGYVKINKKGAITSANLMASDMLGAHKDNLIGRGFSRFVHPKDHEHYFSLIQAVAGGKKRGQKVEIRMLRSGGPPFHAHVEVAPSRGSEGEFTGWRVVFGDISDRKHAEEELKHYAEKLEDSNRELEEFAFVASHDLQEPLRKIRTFSNMMIDYAKCPVDKTSADYLARVQSAAARMQELLHALLQYSRIAARPEPFRRFDLTGTVEDAVSDLGDLIRRTGGKVEISNLPKIYGDPTQVRQLFQNLIANALKFRRDDVQPVVRVHGLPDAERCTIAVEDNGIGFQQQYLPKIFSPFQRLHGRSSKFEGTGMGLAICRKIVGRHRGTITAKSEPGHGSTFIVSLPCEENAMAA